MEILIIIGIIWFFSTINKSNKSYDINGNEIKNRSLVGVFFKFIGILFTIGIVILGGCFLICLMAI